MNRTFSIEKAKAGDPVQVRRGYNARIICYDYQSFKYPIIALVRVSKTEEQLYYYTKSGECSTGNGDYDLIMKEKKVEGWVNIYARDTGGHFCGDIYRTKDQAQYHSDADGYLTTVWISGEVEPEPEPETND